MRFSGSRSVLRAITALGLVLVLLVGAGCGTQGGGQPAAQGGQSAGQAGQTQQAPKEVKVGAIYPLTGSTAQAGQDSRDAILLAQDIVNGVYPDLNLALAKNKGLKNHGGTLIKAIVSDHQGKPEVGQAETERLVTQEKVVAMLGSYQSSVSQPASQAAERMKIPFVTGESASPMLTERGFKYFFRVWPHDGYYVRALFDFMEDLAKKNNVTVKNIALLTEDTLWGQDSAKQMRDNAKRLNLNVVQDIAYRNSATNLDAEVQKLKSADADAVFAASYTSDAILIVKTMKKFGHVPKMFIGNNTGYTHPDLIKNLGNDAAGIASRSATNDDLVDIKPILGKVMDIFQKKFGRPMPDTAVGSFTAAYTLFDAMNRAKSLMPDAIREALAATDLPKEEVIMPSWDGVKFDEKHQNIKVKPIMIQVQQGKFVTVFPDNVQRAKPIYPLQPWDRR